jgi:hypothetical protein
VTRRLRPGVDDQILEAHQVHVDCESCWISAARSYVDVVWSDGTADLLRLCDRCLGEVELELDDADAWQIGPLGPDGMPPQLCGN